MKNMFLLFSITLMFFACGGKQKQTKSYTICEYSTKEELGEIVKGDLKLKYSIGFYDNGSQKYSVGFEGNSIDGDTTYYDIEQPVNNNKKEKDNKIYFYAENGDLLQVSVTKGDTFFMYFGDNLETPFLYQVYSDKKIKIEADMMSGKKRTYSKEKYDENDACTYAIIIQDDLYDESSETIIFEASYEYY